MLLDKAARLFSFPCSPVLLPWFRIPDDGTPANTIHRIAFSLQWQDGNRIKLLAQAFLWPLKAFLSASINVVRFGAAVRAERGISRREQWRQMLLLGNFYNIPPDSYYLFRMFEGGGGRRALGYVANSEIIAIYPAMQKGVDNGIVDDKKRFLRQCLKGGLPVAPVTVIFYGNGTEEWPGGSGLLPDSGLFIKFTDASSAMGSEGWDHDEAARVWCRGSYRLDREQFIDHCRQLARKNDRPVMVQRRLLNHREIAPLSTGALSTFRVVTCLMPDGTAVVIAAGLKMPVGAMEVDNLCAGGIVAGIDLDTGVLGPASGKHSGPVRLNVHPGTGARISGRELACWPEIKALSLKAQGCFPGLWSVGWDIAMTPDGPLIIEGNSYYCVELTQICLRRPLADTMFTSLCAQRLNNRIS